MISELLSSFPGSDAPLRCRHSGDISRGSIFAQGAEGSSSNSLGVCEHVVKSECPCCRRPISLRIGSPARRHDPAKAKSLLPPGFVWTPAALELIGWNGPRISVVEFNPHHNTRAKAGLSACKSRDLAPRGRRRF